MSRKDRTHIFGDGADKSDVTSLKRLTREEFGRRLYKLMMSKGMRQSELARAAGLGRSLVSSYVRGLNFPTPASVESLAKALGMPADQLMPNHVASAIEEDAPAFDFRVSSADPRRGWIRIDRAVSIETGTKIMQLLADDLTNGS